MNRVTYKNREFVLSRQRPGRPVELVEVSTGQLKLVPEAEFKAANPKVTPHELPPVSGFVPFSQRGEDFVHKLQARRQEILQANFKLPRQRRVVSKAPGEKRTPGTRRKSGPSKLAAQISQQLQLQLNSEMAKTSPESMTPQQKQFFETMKKLNSM